MERIAYQQQSTVVSISNDEGRQLYPATSFTEMPSPGVLHTATEVGSQYWSSGSVFGAAGLFLGVGSSMLAKPFLKNDEFDQTKFLYMLPLGLSMSILPSVAACCVYRNTVKEITTSAGQASYFTCAVGTVLLGAWLAFSART